MPKPNRRATDPKCMAGLEIKYNGGTISVVFLCERLKSHLGPHIHRSVGKDIYGSGNNTNFNVAWMTKK